MKKLIFHRPDLGYCREKIIRGELSVLSMFLTDDVGSNASCWIKWANDETSRTSGGNITALSKGDEGIIWLNSLLESPEGIEEDYFEISKESFIYLLEKWEKLYKKRVPKIVLTFDDDYNFLDIYAEE